MMEQKLVVDALRSATESVFSTMLGLEVESGTPCIDTDDPGPSNGIIGLVGLAGEWVGTVSFSCTASLARRMCSRLLNAEFTEVGEDVLDAVSEITNMIVGGFKTEAETYLGPLGISIPTVVYGLSFAARTVGKEHWVVVPFSCGADRFEIKICLSRNRGFSRFPMVTAGHLAVR